jgi:amidase
MPDLFSLDARALVARLRAGDVTPDEALDAAMARIAATDPELNAIPTLCEERARDAIRRLDTTGETARSPAWLAGLPIVIKDLTDVAGVRCTYGSPIYADYVPERSDIMVEALERHGAIVIGKSNTPEFGADSNTFNEVFGATVNPWNTAKTSGGSSGGSAAALAAGQVWLATGSDLGGSLRTPAAFCSVVGLRPSPGRVARSPTRLPFDTLSVEGPMGRTVGDVALMLDAMVGAHPRDPIAMPAPQAPFQTAVEAPTAPRRVAFSRDLGITSMDREVGDICAAAAARFTEMGAIVEDTTPDLHDAREFFGLLRSVRTVAGLGGLVEQHRDMMKPDIVWEIDARRALGADEIGRAERARGALAARFAAFFDDYDVLLCPATAEPPFDVGRRYVQEIDDKAKATLHESSAVASAISLTGCPALSLPCGFTGNGLPVGLQMITRPRGEAALLSFAALAESLFDIARKVPIDPKAPPLT